MTIFSILWACYMSEKFGDNNISSGTHTALAITIGLAILWDYSFFIILLYA